mmetsp:Transcript_11363/g.33719  ORF Transcript_11363/g.33719 Transcript_11363/m.33719 type:complete len:82 (-) Transcript_11363:404-649(-)
MPIDKPLHKTNTSIISKVTRIAPGKAVAQNIRRKGGWSSTRSAPTNILVLGKVWDLGKYSISTAFWYKPLLATSHAPKSDK